VEFSIGTDVGGTFTDLWVACSDGRGGLFKSPTTADVLGGVLDAMRLATEYYDLSFEAFCGQISRFGHGTTIGLNALLTGRASKTAVLTTRGFADTLEIGRLRRQTSGLNETEYTDAYLRNRFTALVPRSLIFEIDERVDAAGRIVTPLEEAHVLDTLAQLAANQVEAVAICLLWATHNPAHEIRLREIVRGRLPSAFVSVSHEISPSVGEYARMSTTAANAALGPVAGRYLGKLEDTLRAAGMKVPVLMMTCAGGVLPTAVLNERPVFALFSGPAAGVMGSTAIGIQIGAENLLTTDIGGTSFDVGVVVKGKAISRSEIVVAGADMRVPSIDVASIGAGGGSVAFVEFGELHVGPRSAGANPGPACYGRGGTLPTATDADLVLGVLDPDNFLGGRMKLDVDASHRAIDQHVAKPLGLSVMAAAWGIRQVLDSKMADLLRRVTIERGYDPADFTLLANGGAGPSHAWVLSEELGLPGFVVPAVATTMSAFGTGNSDMGITSERPAYTRLAPGAEPSIEQSEVISAALREAGEEVIRHLKLAASHGLVKTERFISLRYRGQSHSVDVALTGDTFDRATYRAALEAFESQYESLFGRGAAFSSAGVEIILVRAMGTAALPAPKRVGEGTPLRRVGIRPVVFRDPEVPVDTVIYSTTYPRAGETVQGPAIIEFPGQSAVIPPGALVSADSFGNLHVGVAK
jgi:N-methylhydantoinase A